jgi:hypothetical protein
MSSQEALRPLSTTRRLLAVAVEDTQVSHLNRLWRTVLEQTAGDDRIIDLDERSTELEKVGPAGR